jgi:biopolymer transport protein ExbD
MKLPSPIPRKHSRIEIIPLIDIMFFLLAAFMMVSLQMDRTENIKVNLPGATQAQPDFKPDMIHVVVDKAGGIWIAKNQVALPELAAFLNERARQDKDASVYISGDRDTLHGRMVGVLQTARAAGIQKVAFMVGGEEEHATP